MSNGGCYENCTNTEGSFHCSCDLPGYEVISNDLPCQGLL